MENMEIAFPVQYVPLTTAIVSALLQALELFLALIMAKVLWMWTIDHVRCGKVTRLRIEMMQIIDRKGIILEPSFWKEYLSGGRWLKPIKLICITVVVLGL